MNCPQCGFDMDAFDLECPRCARLRAKGTVAAPSSHQSAVNNTAPLTHGVLIPALRPAPLENGIFSINRGLHKFLWPAVIGGSLIALLGLLCIGLSLIPTTTNTNYGRQVPLIDWPHVLVFFMGVVTICPGVARAFHPCLAAPGDRGDERSHPRPGVAHHAERVGTLAQSSCPTLHVGDHPATTTSANLLRHARRYSALSRVAHGPANL